jgi:tetratricopeptide (TPR) repeat protein
MVIAAAASSASGQNSMEVTSSLPQPAGADMEKIDNWMQEGDAANQEGSITKAFHAYEEAARLMRKEISRSPLDAGLWQKLGLIYQHCNKTDEVLAAYKQAVRLQPANAQYHLDLGMTLAKTGALDSAISEILETIQLNPENGENYTILGRMYALHGNKEKAIAAYQKSLELNLPESIADRIRQSLNTLLSDDTPVRKESEFEYWIHKVDEWRNAVIKHKPGLRDEAAVTIGSWPVRDLEIVIRTVMSLNTGPKELVEIKIDRNVLAKRGAVLHTDIALYQLETGVNEGIEKKQA